jgi:hypothetical protein
MKRYSIVFLCLSLFLTACPDPEGKYNRYLAESAKSDALLRKDQTIEDQMIKDQMIDTGDQNLSDGSIDSTLPIDQSVFSCDPNGKYFLGLYSDLYLTNRIAFLTEIKATQSNGKYKVTELSLQALNCADRTKVEGDPIIVTGAFPIADDGTFEVPLGEVSVVGGANCQTGREIRATITLQSQLNTDCSYLCGKIEGDLILPFQTSLTDNSTFGAERVSGLDAIMPADQPKKACGE